MHRIMLIEACQKDFSKVTWFLLDTALLQSSVVWIEYWYVLPAKYQNYRQHQKSRWKNFHWIFDIMKLWKVVLPFVHQLHVLHFSGTKLLFYHQLNQIKSILLLFLSFLKARDTSFDGLWCQKCYEFLWFFLSKHACMKRR